MFSGPIVWAIALLCFAMLLIVMEMFVPSGGGLGFMAACAVAASIGLAYYADGIRGGTIFLSIAVFSLPILFWAFVKWWPDTPIGRMLVAKPPVTEDIIPDDHGLGDLIGQLGTATTPMLPAGVIRVAGRTYDALSEGLAIEQGSPIKVLSVSCGQVLVRSLTAHEEQVSGHVERVSNGDDPMSRPLEELGLEALDDPLA